MKVLVCGSRHFDCWHTLCQHLDSLYSQNTDIKDGKVDFTIIEGGAKGADFLARVWAKFRMLPFREYPADWATHGKRAGLIRNAHMLATEKPDCVLAFLAPNSRGTKDMIAQAERAGVRTVVVDI